MPQGTSLQYLLGFAAWRRQSGGTGCFRMIQECLRDYLVQVIYGLDVAAAEWGWPGSV